MDRQIGNTQGYSGVAAAAIIAGEELNEFHSQPPLVVLGRFFSRELHYLDASYGIDHLPPFPDTVMIQLAQDVVGSNFGLHDPKLLADNFSYLEPSMGPFNKMVYLEKFSEFGILDAVTDMDYGITNYRVDPNNPYRVWVDIRAKGTRTGAIGRAIPKISNAKYEAAPEAMVSSSRCSILIFSRSMTHQPPFYALFNSPFHLMMTDAVLALPRRQYLILYWATLEGSVECMDYYMPH